MPIPSSTAANGATTTSSSSSAAVNTAHLGDMITAVLANHDSLREENAQLYRQLDDALRRAKNAENAMAVSRSPNSTALANAQAQLDNEQAAHAETRAHLRAIQEAWAELERYASILDVRAADARSIFSTILRDPVAASQRLPPLRPPSPFVPPRRATATSAVTTAIAPTPNSIAPTRTLQALPTMPTLPPVPSSLAPRRHRADSLEGRPAKRARPDVAHHPPEQIACPPPYYSAPAPERYHPSYAVYPQRQLARGRSPARRTPPVHVSTNGTAPDTTAVSNSNANVTTSPSRSRSRSRSMSVDDLLLEATESQPSAPPFQHVFTQPVTGPPRKRLEKSGTMIEPYNAASNARMSNTAAAAGLPAGGFPAQNDKGQRICRQCGLPGRYKDGKCVEKWGPGPEGPGTVCDRCRKKMKRVERRGTLDPHALSNQGSQHAPAPPSPPSLPPLTATHTAPARTQLAHPPIAALRSPPSPSRSPSLSPPRSTGYPPAGGRRYTPPARAPYSPNPKQYKRSPSDRDADGETEDPRDGDDDADVDDDLLEAIDAAEESRSNGHGPHMHTMNGIKREILDVLV